MIVMMSSRVKAVYAAAPAGGDLEPTCGRNRTFSQFIYLRQSRRFVYEPPKAV
jgi:hypothetical protein